MIRVAARVAALAGMVAGSGQRVDVLTWCLSGGAPGARTLNPRIKSLPQVRSRRFERSRLAAQGGCSYPGEQGRTRANCNRKCNPLDPFMIIPMARRPSRCEPVSGWSMRGRSCSSLGDGCQCWPRTGIRVAVRAVPSPAHHVVGGTCSSSVSEVLELSQSVSTHGIFHSPVVGDLLCPS